MLTSSQALHSWYMLFFQLPRLPEMGITGPGQRLFRRTLRRSGLPDASIDRYLAVLSQPGAATGALNWYRALPFVPPSKMPPVAVPALYLYGTGDFALGRKAAELTARYVRGPYRFEVLEGVSHWIPEEVPDRVAALVIEHARAYGGRTG
jgi:pimeloyl-ACP methyl ester carboxylesterase